MLCLSMLLCILEFMALEMNVALQVDLGNLVPLIHVLGLLIFSKLFTGFFVHHF